MHRRSFFVFLAVVLMIGILASPAAGWSPLGHKHKTVYYLSLGTSLAFGIQASQEQGNICESVPSEVSYPGLLADYLRKDIKKLNHVNLGCPGETSDTFIGGGTCDYPHGSQLDEAVEFLSLRGKSTGLITIDIGANDALSCIDGADIDYQCFGETVKRLDANLRTILETLQDAAPGVPIVGMNYYNPLLVFYFDSPEFAALTAVLQAYLNLTLESAYKDFGVPMADVAGAFMSDDLVTDYLPPPGGNGYPDSVDLNCTWTWMCYCAQIDPELANIHPQDAGYAVIAEAFVEVLPPIQTCKKPWWHRHRFWH